MKRILMMLLTIVLVKMSCFSQTTSTDINQDSIVYVTASQIKYANLIFVEHDKLLTENNLLNRKINVLEGINRNYESIDSVRAIQIYNYKDAISSNEKQIEKLTKDVNNQKRNVRGWQIGCFSVGLALALFLIFK